jgi:hypothetical protein
VGREQGHPRRSPLLHEQVSNVDVSLVPEPESAKDAHGYYHEYLQGNAKAAQHVPQPRSGRPVAILCGLLPPVDGFVGILGYALSEVVGKGEVERALGIPGHSRPKLPYAYGTRPRLFSSECGQPN